MTALPAPNLSAVPYKRQRRTNAEIEKLQSAIVRIVEDHDELTVRHLFYLMVSEGLIEKTEASYKNVVIRLTLQLRRSGDIPYGKIVDGTRLYRLPRTYGSVGEALQETARVYRRNYWSDADELVEVWCEKEAISGFLADVTRPLAVPLMITRGFASESVAQSLAEDINNDERPMTILFVSDLDPSGNLMPDDVLRRVRHYAPDADISLVRVAVTPEQVELFNLPTRPTKTEGNRHARGFEGDSVEVDAMPPDVLKDILRQEIEQRMDPDQLRILRVAEASEREQLKALSGSWGK